MLTAWLGVYMFVVSIFIGSVDKMVALPLAVGGLVTMTVVIREKKGLLVAVGLLFLLRILLSVNFEEYRPGDRISLETRGKRVEKMEGKYPIGAVYTDMGEEGKSYRGTGRIAEVISEGDYTFYKMKGTRVVMTEEGFFRRSLRERTRELTKAYSRGLRGFYEGVIAGEKGRIEEDLKEKFSYTGTSHLIVISGLHIGVIIALTLYLAGKLPLNRSGRYFLTMGILSVYSAAVWGSPSVIRAYIMGMCYLAAGLLYEEPDIRKSYFAAMIINLFLTPLGAVSVSFQMSYMAVFSIIFIYPVVEERIRERVEKGWLKIIVETAALSLVIQIMLTPIFITTFRSIPIFSFLINIIAIPLGVVFVQGAFLALLFSFIGLGGLLMPTVNLLYLGLTGLIEVSSKVPLLSIEYRGVTGGYILILLYVFIYTLSRKPLRKMSLILLIIILFMNTERYSSFEGKEIRYYSARERIIVADRRVKERGLDYLWDNRIRGGEVFISPKKQEDGVLSKLSIKDAVVLAENEEVIVGGMRFRNIQGEIVLVEER